MSVFSYIKSFFAKELEDIVKPLNTIKLKVESFIAKQEAMIDAEAQKAKEIMEKNKQRVENNIKAATIIKNFEALLGVK